MTERDLLIEVKDIKTYFFLDEGTVRAVDGCSFDILRGQTVGVVGESGCGKSVTAQSILRIVPPPGRIVSGEIIFHRKEKGNQASTVVEAVRLDQLNDRGARDSRDSRERDRHDLSGADDVLVPGAHDRRSDHGSDHPAPEGGQGRGAEAGDRDVGAGGYAQAGAAGGRRIRTSCRAACGSGR